MKQIDFSRWTGIQPGNNEVSRQAQPQRELRPQPEKERSPDYYNRGREAEGASNFSGGNWGGGIWSGRSR